VPLTASTTISSSKLSVKDDDSLSENSLFSNSRERQVLGRGVLGEGRYVSGVYIAGERWGWAISFSGVVAA